MIFEPCLELSQSDAELFPHLELFAETELLRWDVQQVAEFPFGIV